MNESRLTQAKQMLRRANLKARKGLAQHFLVDGTILKRILTAADLSPEDVVVEVGPGMGVLTRELAQNAGQVIAVELDGGLATLLRESLAEFSNLTVINDDILKIDLAALVPAGKAYKVVANLPYYIAAPVLRRFLEAKTKLQTMVVMVQREVAKQIVAEPGQRSLLTIAIQFYGQPKIVTKVPARAFYPAPKVDSAVLKIDVNPTPPAGVDEVSFFQLARAGFTNPRKQVSNSLAQGLGIEKADALALLEKAGIAHERRSETFTLDEWLELWRAWKQ